MSKQDHATTAAQIPSSTSSSSSSSTTSSHRRHHRLFKFSIFNKGTRQQQQQQQPANINNNKQNSSSTSTSSSSSLPSKSKNERPNSMSENSTTTTVPTIGDTLLTLTTTDSTTLLSHRPLSSPVPLTTTTIVNDDNNTNDEGKGGVMVVLQAPIIEVNGEISNDSEDDPLAPLPTPNSSSSNAQNWKRSPNPASDSLVSSHYNPRRGSLFVHRHSDDQIVTPFAQVLSSLRKVKMNFAHIANAFQTTTTTTTTTLLKATSGDAIETPKGENARVNDEKEKLLAKQALEELEWCLEQLETIQTHRSVSEMATNKFKKLLNQELSQFSEEKSGMQISQYLTSTFLDNDSLPAEERGDENNSLHDDLTPLEKVVEEDNEGYHESLYGQESGDHNNSHLDQQDKLRLNDDNMTSESISTDPTDINRRVSEHSENSIRFKGRRLSPTIETDLNISENIDTMVNSLPRYGVECLNPVSISELMENSLDCWGIDIFKVAEFTNNRPLTCVTYTIFKKRGFMHKFEIDPRCLIRYLLHLENHYHSDTPYHNSIHAADVTQSTHVLLLAQALSNVFSDLELLAALYACSIHDVNHPGLTNQYLVNTNDRLAVLYNDSSVLENHHLAVAFSLLREKDCDIFANLSKKQRLTLRRMVIDMVLATDMSKHMSLLADLKTMVETKKVAGSGVLNLDNYNDKIQILQNMVHCADLSNPTKPLELYHEWTARIMEEFFRQGDKERAAGLDISPMCDRDTASIEKSQVSFIDFIAHPLWETWADLVHPDAQEIFDMLQENRDWYCSKIDPTAVKDRKPTTTTTTHQH